MHPLKQFATGVAILCLAAFCVRHHYCRWRDHFGDTVDDYLDQWTRGYILPVAFIGFLFLLGGALVCASFVPGGEICFLLHPPYVCVLSTKAPP